MAAIPKTSKALHQINFAMLNVNQLYQLKQQFEQDISVYHELWQALNIAHGKFADSAENIKKLKPNQDVLVPLTGSMYVPGHIGDTDTMIIDIGAGYYAQKNVKESKEYFKRKIEYVSQQMESVQSLRAEKSKIHDSIIVMIEKKLESTIERDKASKS